MAAVAARIRDRRVLRLIRRMLTAGALDGARFETTREGTTQGGPLSPLLSNLVLDELDRELERRGHRFVRYADDCNVYLRTARAGRRVMTSLARFIEGRLRLRINAEKSAVDRPWHRSFLGFTIRRKDAALRRCIAAKAVTRFKDRVHALVRLHRGVDPGQLVPALNRYLRGWAGYFGFGEDDALSSLDAWTRRQLPAAARSCFEAHPGLVATSLSGEGCSARKRVLGRRSRAHIWNKGGHRRVAALRPDYAAALPRLREKRVQRWRGSVRGCRLDPAAIQHGCRGGGG